MIVNNSRNKIENISPKMDGVLTLSALVKLLPSLVQQLLFYEVQLGYVLRVPSQDERSAYGQIQCKMLFADEFTSGETGVRLIPRDLYDMHIPVPGEIVLCSWHPDQRLDPRNGPNFPQGYYFGILGILNKQNHNAMLGAWMPPDSEKSNFDQNQNLEGQYFKSNQQLIPQLPYRQGDKIISGRFGNTIRFTSTYNTDQSILFPEIMISNNNYNCVGEDGEYSTESIAKSGTSLYFTYFDQHKENIIDISSSRDTLDKDGVFSLEGNSLLANSDQIVINSVKKGVEVYASTMIGLSAKQNIVLQSNNNAEIVVRKSNLLVTKDAIECASDNVGVIAQKTMKVKSPKITIDSSQINLGQSPSQPLVLGNQLVSLLSELCAQCSVIAVPSFGSPPVNAVAFSTISAKLNKILSKTSKTK